MRAGSAQPGWRTTLTDIEPMFADIEALLSRRLPPGWPQPHQLTALLPFPARTRTGQPVRFVTASGQRTGAIGYEQVIHDTGAVPTRPQSWHDTLNALIWALYPQAKAAINAGHVAESHTAHHGRSRRRDALTLLDETGIVIASCDPLPEFLNRGHRWRELFVERRHAWWRTVRPFPFGHGLLEQCLAPYVGLTAKAIHLPVPVGFHALPLHRQYALIDDALAQRVAGLDHPAALLPLPVLGIPGWDPRNADPAFYDDESYFRS